MPGNIRWSITCTRSVSYTHLDVYKRQDPEHQGHGYGKALITFLEKTYSTQYSILQVGTGDVPSTVLFYEACGFHRSHRIKNFFIDHYDHPIYEDGMQLMDMVYLQKNLSV